MTIAEKIIYLRTQAGLNQEQLADALFVTRQSVSKWEMGLASPQIGKVQELCRLFHISADELINDDVDLIVKGKPEAKEETHHKYFGTDGFRGESNIGLTAFHAFKIGRFLGWYYSRPQFGAKRAKDEHARIVIGKDTRKSSYMFEYALASGITASGADAYILHVTTTPSVSYIARTDDFDAGVMITASHNIFYDNGIKILNGNGEKIDDEVTSLVEAYLDHDMAYLGINGEDLPYAKREDIGAVVDYVAGRNRYIGFLISAVAKSFRKLRIGIDCANGASWSIARSVFNALGAETIAIGTDPNGLNVNLNCGSTHMDRLVELVKANNLDCGFAFDGDADRCLAVDEKGHIVDGDKILYILGREMADKGRLNGNAIAMTIMSNSGLTKSLAQIGIGSEITAVGDKNVYDRMVEKDLSIGGEKTGHIILRKYATTGDGILTALKIAEAMLSNKASLSKLASNVSLYPQVTKNARVRDPKETVNDPAIKAKQEEITAKLGGEGRILLRPSGTEPVVRIMVEASTEAKCTEYANAIYSLMKKGGYLNEQH